MSIHVLVSSDHSIIRDGLVELLRGQRGLEATGLPLDAPPDPEQRADVIISPIDPRPDLASVLSRIRHAWPNAPVLCLLLAQDDAAVVSALRAGVRGVIDDTFGARELTASIQQAVAGQFVMSKPLATRLARQYALNNGDDQRKASDELTQREREVLALLAEGGTNRDIATTLCVSEHTVRAHLRAIMQKLQVTNRVQAAAFAMRSHSDRNHIPNGGAAKGREHVHPHR